MKIAMLGGSFNPPHRGHILLAKAAMKIGYDRVLLIPAAHPPHKERLEGASGRDRWNMAVLTAAALIGVEAWDGELKRRGVSYSIETVREIIRVFSPEGRPGLIFGDDLAEDFRTWKEADRLAVEAELVMARRDIRGSRPFPYPCRRLENPLFPHSSTKVRELLARGMSVDDLLLPEVAAYVREHGLYTGRTRE